MSSPFSRKRQKRFGAANQPLPAINSSFRKRCLTLLFLPILFSSLVVTVTLGGIRQKGYLQFLELTAYDHLVRLTSHQGLDDRLLIIGINEKDLQKQQQGELSDAVIAKLLRALQQHRPAVIGLDIFRDVPHPPGEEALAQALKAENIIVPTQLPNSESQGVPPPLGIPASRVGFVDLIIDPDNVVRRYFLYGQSPNGQVKAYAFALQIALKYLESRNKKVFKVFPDDLQISSTVFPRLSSTSGGYQLPASEAQGWQVLLKYDSPQVARQISLEQLLTGDFEPNWLENKIILVGYVAPSKKDTFPTPYSAANTTNFEMPGVKIHGLMVSQIIKSVLEDQPSLTSWSNQQEWIWIWGWSWVGGILVWRTNRLVPLLSGVLLAVGGIWSLSLLFYLQGFWIPFVPALLGLALTGASLLAYKVLYRTYHDPLTELPNRRLFLQNLQKFNRVGIDPSHDQVTLFFLDIDGFNKINAALGPEAGDCLLKAIALKLKQLFQDQAFLGRVGGDEFAICLKSAVDNSKIDTIVALIHQELAEIFIWQGTEIRSTASVGIAHGTLGREFQARELLRYADIAMNRAKEAGKDRHDLYLAGMDLEATQRWELEIDLWNALKNQEFRLYYQPIISLKNRKIAGFEALVRWQSSKRGFVSPSAFIPIAEETGLIVELGQWILKEACRQMRTWQQMFPQHQSVIMSVNLSSRQFSQPNLVSQIALTLEQIGLSGEMLKLEITESMMMNDVEAAIELLKRLKALGLRLSIDDFGTGYSSLSYLHRFPIDTLKIDRSFVSRMDLSEDEGKYSQIVRTIIALGHNLELDVIAEGIETSDQVQILQDLECEYGQGYFFAKPLSKEVATELLRQSS